VHSVIPYLHSLATNIYFESCTTVSANVPFTKSLHHQVFKGLALLMDKTM